MRKYLRQFSGVVSVALGLFILLSLVTYHSGDPSMNSATGEAAHNLGGNSGALLSDMLLQTLGLASVMLVAAFLSWGWKLLKEAELKIFWLKLSALCIALVSLSAMLTCFESPRVWPIASGLGGAIGALIYDRGVAWLPGFLIGLLGALVTVGAVPVALGLNRNEWLGVSRVVAKPMSYLKQTGYLVHAAITGEIGPHLKQALKKKEPTQSKETSNKPPSFIKKVKGGEEKQTTVTTVTPESSNSTAVESKVSRSKKAEPKKQASLELRPRLGDYEMPPFSLLKDGSSKAKKRELSDSSLKQNAKLLATVLEDFGVKGEITNIRPGPVVTLYELEPAAGTKSARVVGLADDIARSMSAISARIAVIPGRNAIGIELPNLTRDTVYLRGMLEDDEFTRTTCSLPIALGKDIGGDPVIVDLARMPHLLVAGTTGSGKSVAINTMIMSLVYQLSPEQCKFIMIDPKMLELSVYDGIPHLLTPVVTEPGKAVVALKWTVKEMENRYRLMATLGVRNIDNFNKRIREARQDGEELTREVQTGFDPDTGRPTYETQDIPMESLPYIVVIVDEMADLMLVSGKEIEGSIQRLAQMARASGIHLIMATQRPSVDVITGVIKANFPTRVSFQVTSKIDSRTILGEQGAEQLLGQGDMLYMAGGGRITRVHGPFVSDREVEEVVRHLKKQGEPLYIEAVTQDDEDDMFGFEDEEETEEDRLLFDKAVAVVARDRKASTSYIQRCLKIGYNRAARIIEKMEREGIVGPANHVGKREILVREEDA